MFKTKNQKKNFCNRTRTGNDNFLRTGPSLITIKYATFNRQIQGVRSTRLHFPNQDTNTHAPNDRLS